MPNPQDDNRRYTVLMHTEVGDQIDYSLSPIDGAIAVAQIRDLLPSLHRPKWWQRLIPGYIRVYRGSLGWAPCRFRYVQIGDTLHVVTGGRHAPCCPSDVVLPEPDVDRYIQEETDHGGGVITTTIACP